MNRCLRIFNKHLIYDDKECEILDSHSCEYSIINRHLEEFIRVNQVFVEYDEFARCYMKKLYLDKNNKLVCLCYSGDRFFFCIRFNYQSHFIDESKINQKFYKKALEWKLHSVF